jgi:signal transduction histidine kinase
VNTLTDHGAYDILIQPFQKPELVFLCVKKALRFSRLRKENMALIRSLREANVQLEQRVKQRTALQANLNEKLRIELESRRKIESALRKAKERAEVANRAKSAFMAGMSHELRNPLNSVMGFCQVLQEKFFGPLTEKQEAYVKDIYESGKHLLDLINDILELVGIDSENKPMETRSVNLPQLLDNSLNMIHHKALKHGFDIGLDIDNDLQEGPIQLDPMRFKQIMFNLLSNAVKFTPDGGKISVNAEKIVADSSRNEREILKIAVSDNGDGVDERDRNKIFDDFYQAKRGTTDKTPGAGLGLSIARKLVHQHGGKIWVESEGAEKGSRFIFVIPI